VWFCLGVQGQQKHDCKYVNINRMKNPNENFAWKIQVEKLEKYN